MYRRGNRGRSRRGRTKVIRKRNCTIIIKPKRRNYGRRW